ncbi:MAG: Uma2 family endonuclease [Pirellulaceae bacterium]|nr:Uma2 family endonuclease [Planctomycetales bacterium]
MAMSQQRSVWEGKVTMKGVMLEVPAHILEERRISGADQWDEVWDGVLHMNPPPSVAHQDLEGQIELWLRQFWVPTGLGNKVFHQVALSPDENWVHNYRTPDVVLFRPAELLHLQPTYCHGPCSVAIEIRSPGDETYEKLAFYAQLKVPEIWVIDSDSRAPEVHKLDATKYQRESAGVDGWFTSAAINAMLKQDGNSLLIQIVGDEATRRKLPE